MTEWKREKQLRRESRSGGEYISPKFHQFSDER